MSDEPHSPVGQAQLCAARELAASLHAEYLRAQSTASLEAYEHARDEWRLAEAALAKLEGRAPRMN